LARRVRTGVVDDPYGELEAKLTASFQKSPWQRTFELLDMPDLGDRRPSVLMDAMLALLKTPADMAAAANRLFDSRPQGATVTAMSSARAGRSPSLARRNRSPAWQNDRRQQSSRRSDGNGLCYYHDNFGNKAVKCQPPCAWPGNGQNADGCTN
jgi:hypothetical protein